MSNALTTVNSNASMSVVLEEGLFTKAVKISEIMASAKSLVPKHLHGNPGDCFAVTCQALRWGMDPFVVGSQMSIVSGNPCYSGQLVNSVVVNSGILDGRLSFDWKDLPNNDIECTVSGTIKGEKAPRTKTIKMSEQIVRNSPLWKTDPKQQLAYLCTRKWARLHCPEVLLGVYTRDEFEDMPQQQMQDVTPKEPINHQTIDAVVESVRNPVEPKWFAWCKTNAEKVKACKTFDELLALQDDLKADMDVMRQEDESCYKKFNLTLEAQSKAVSKRLNAEKQEEAYPLDDAIPFGNEQEAVNA